MSDKQAPGSSLALRRLLKRYGETVAVDGVSLDVKAGEFVTLLGPSGSGKTTTLNLIAGFTPPTAGEILVGERDVSRIPAYRRNIGVVFQNYLLFPHMSVFQNVEFPLVQRRVSRPERQRRVMEALELVRLERFADRRPRQLSGGQQQRVALARAIVFQPPLLLMDEPLGALDKKLREALQLEIKRVHREVGITFVYVTHDQEEALVLSDRIAIFNSGRIEQVGTAEEVYERPSSVFAARFIGESNCLSGRLETDGGDVRISSEAFSLRAELPSGKRVESPIATILVRPEHLRVGPPGTIAAENILLGRVKQAIYLGSARRLEIDVPGAGTLVARESGSAISSVGAGGEVDVGWDARDSWLIGEQADIPSDEAADEIAPGA